MTVKILKIHSYNLGHSFIKFSTNTSIILLVFHGVHQPPGGLSNQITEFDKTKIYRIDVEDDSNEKCGFYL